MSAKTLAPDTLTPVLTAHWDQQRSWTLAAYEQTGGYAALRKAMSMPAADVLAVVKDSGDFSDYDRIILHHVVTVTALELVKKKAVDETEKRLAGDFFDVLIASDLYEEELARRLAFFGGLFVVVVPA